MEMVPEGSSGLPGGEQVPGAAAGIIICCTLSPVLGELDFCPRLICRGKLIMFV